MDREVVLMKKFGKLLPMLVFFLMIYGIPVWGIVQEDRTYSSSENRMLQTFPKISERRIFRGKFQKQYELYLSDQFPARDVWIQVKSRTERLAGKTESNSVYFGKQGYLLEKYTQEDFSRKQIRKNIRALKNFVEGFMPEKESEKGISGGKAQAGKKRKQNPSADSDDIHVKILMVPSKTDVLEKYLPLFAEGYDEGRLYERLEKALPEGILVPAGNMLEEHADEYIYYRNDHHWTTLGAWYGYRAYLQACNDLAEERGAERKKQALKTVSRDFLGTTYSRVNMYSKKDEISVYEPEGEFSVIYNLGEKTETTFYQWEFLEKKDQYSVFSGGNQGVLEITGGKKNGKTLMVVKDSFANCLIPFLMEDYEKLVVVDMRQLNAGLSMVTRRYQPTDVLVVYNLVQFMQDRDFAMKP